MARALACAALAAVVLLIAVPAADCDGKRRGKRSRKKTNEPRGWVWPPDEAMDRQGDECLVRLDERDVAFRRARRVPRIPTPVVVPDMVFGGVALVPRFREPPFVLECHLALALARVGPVLRELGVKELRFSTIHDFRQARVNGTTKPTLSRHSYALAVDVFEVVTDDGTVWSVEESFGAAEDSPPNILVAVEAAINESGRFRRVLSPQNDPISHKDHFHLEARLLELELTKEERAARAEARAQSSPRKRKARRSKKSRRRARQKKRRRRKRDAGP